MLVDICRHGALTDTRRVPLEHNCKAMLKIFTNKFRSKAKHIYRKRDEVEITDVNIHEIEENDVLVFSASPLKATQPNTSVSAAKPYTRSAVAVGLEPPLAVNKGDLFDRGSAGKAGDDNGLPCMWMRVHPEWKGELAIIGKPTTKQFEALVDDEDFHAIVSVIGKKEGQDDIRASVEKFQKDWVLINCKESDQFAKCSVKPLRQLAQKTDTDGDAAVGGAWAMEAASFMQVADLLRRGQRVLIHSGKKDVLRATAFVFVVLRHLVRHTVESAFKLAYAWEYYNGGTGEMQPLEFFQKIETNFDDAMSQETVGVNTAENGGDVVYFPATYLLDRTVYMSVDPLSRSDAFDPEAAVKRRTPGEVTTAIKNAVDMHVVANESLVEQEALKQLEKSAYELPGVKFAIGMPDLHPGKGFPIGTVFATQGVIYPHLIGSDIGCGMTLYKTNISAQSNKSRKVEGWTHQLADSFEGAWDGDWKGFLQSRNVDVDAVVTKNAKALGTVGGGNHFAELQEVVEVLDPVTFASLGGDTDQLHLLVHSGSRGYGHDILVEHENTYSTMGLKLGSNAAQEYLKKHDNACEWAKCNREVIARRFFDAIGASGEQLLDIWHNNMTEKTLPDNSTAYLHRKGAAPADKGAVVIPGSRGAHSYLVKPKEDTSSSGYSLAHGAGRKWSRGKARGLVKDRYKAAALQTTALGSRVVCADTNLLYEEAPEAYKEISSIITDLETANVVDVIAVLAPVVTFKTG
eukprot:GFYU01013942.1.p1 GENE.GFYU01013942.1~~GFYU01013942.1.p1  ORF type:complete len:791 (-),score=167.86 GFYU01013942.1:481-2715(-)